MLFRKKIPRCCGYCVNGTKLNNDEVLCIKHGMRLIDKPCCKFRYDPCKRVPPKPKVANFKKYDKEDFSL